MTKIERAQQRLVVQSGSTTLTLNKESGKATMQSTHDEAVYSAFTARQIAARNS